MKRSPRTPGSSKKKAASRNQAPALSTPDIEKLRGLANSCHTPTQFKTLLDQLKRHIPYERFICGWGNPATFAISFFYAKNYPEEFLNWYLTTGMLEKDPVFNRWLRTGQPQIFAEVVNDLGDRFPLDFIKKTNEFSLVSRQLSSVG